MSADNNLSQMENNHRSSGTEDPDTRIKAVSCLGTKTKRERYMMLGLTTILFVAVILAFSLASLLVRHTKGTQASLEWLPDAEPLFQDKAAASVTPNSIAVDDLPCLEKGCVKAAAAVIGRLNEEVNPCDDFFEFACGNFVKKTIIPDEKSSVTMFSVVSDELREKLRLVIEEEISETDPPASKLVKNLYASCTNTAEIQKAGLKPLKAILKELGEWPVVVGSTWNETNYSWIETNYKNRELGYSADYLFDFSVTTDIRNSTWRMVWFDQASVGLSREYILRGLNDTDVQAYLQYMIDSAILLGADPDQADKDMRDVLDLQTKIANISLPREERRNMTRLYNTMTMAELSVLVPEIPWVDYINKLLPPPLTVNDTERIGVSDINYFKNLTKILEETPNRVIANYMLWRVVSASVSYLSEDIRAIQMRYNTKLTGKTTRPPRWKECMGYTSSKLSFAVGSIYIRNFFNKEAKSQAVQLVTYLREEFKKILKTIDWMDDVTRKEALKKASAIKSHIGYPDELLIDEKLTEHYVKLSVEPKGLLDNMRRIAVFGTDYSFSRLREMVDKLDWKRQASVAVVNAYYSSIENSIKFPAGILQGVFFEPDRPKYMNYGGIGFVIGHEITHGFDDQGKQFDDVGNLKNWWAPSTESKFLTKAKCIINQYGNYTAPENGMKLNGINTQGENIADNGGIKEAYNAYHKWAKDNGAEKKLPGLHYSTSQLFWISSAQVWCSKYRPEALKVRILTGVHSPGRFRVNGPFSNFEQFSKDWNCPLGSKMNPIDKCRVW